MCRGLCTEMSKYTKDEILYITAFCDCGSKSVVIRLPYRRSKLFNDYLQEGLKSL